MTPYYDPDLVRREGRYTNSLDHIPEGFSRVALLVCEDLQVGLDANYQSTVQQILQYKQQGLWDEVHFYLLATQALDRVKHPYI